MAAFYTDPTTGVATGGVDPLPWWQSVLGYAVTAVVDAKTKPPALQSGVQYQVDAAGNVVPMGVTHVAPAPVTAALTSNPLVLFGVLALGALLLYKLVK